MRSLGVLFLLLFSLISAPASGQGDLIDLTIRCPGGAEVIDVNFKNHLQGSYFDSSGKSSKLDFEGEGGTGVRSIPYRTVRRDGQTIICEYRGECSMMASYRYRVHREIVSCVPYTSSREIRCKVKA